ncbi:MAG: hypothetical protein H7A00_10265 [Hahellaceae bacterium]|nr:hypothetical protein [Hahellaceae bacterium]
MAAKVFVSVGRDVTQPHALHWALFTSAEAPAASGICPDAEALALILAQNQIVDGQLIGILPSRLVLATRVNIPAKQSRYLQQALPFAVEEQVIQDVEELHLVLAGKLKNDTHGVLAIPHLLMDVYSDIATQTGMPLIGIYVDAQLLPAMSGGDKLPYSLFLEGDWFTLASPELQFIQSKSENLAYCIESFVIAPADTNESEQEKKELSCFLTSEQQVKSQLLLAQIDQEIGVSLAVKTHTSDVFTLSCLGWFSRPRAAVNLCQGAYRSLVAQKSPLTRWYSAAAVLLVGLLLQVGMNIGQGFYYQSLAKQEQQLALENYKKIFPNSRNVTAGNLERDMKGKLKVLNAQGPKAEFLELLSQTGIQYKKQPKSEAIIFRNIQFSDQRNELVLELNTETFEQLDLFKNSLAETGLGVKISSAVKEQGVFRGRLHIVGS